LRRDYEAFRRTLYNDVSFVDFKNNPLALEYKLKYKGEEFVVLLNANTELNLDVNLVKGEWEVLVDETSAGVTPLRTISDNISVLPSSGIVLKKK
jgi:hypothetical protein